MKEWIRAFMQEPEMRWLIGDLAVLVLALVTHFFAMFATMWGFRGTEMRVVVLVGSFLYIAGFYMHEVLVAMKILPAKKDLAGIIILALFSYVAILVVSA